MSLLVLTQEKHLAILVDGLDFMVTLGKNNTVRVKKKNDETHDFVDFIDLHETDFAHIKNVGRGKTRLNPHFSQKISENMMNIFSRNFHTK